MYRTLRTVIKKKRGENEDFFKIFNSIMNLKVKKSQINEFLVMGLRGASLRQVLPMLVHTPPKLPLNGVMHP